LDFTSPMNQATTGLIKMHHAWYAAIIQKRIIFCATIARITNVNKCVIFFTSRNKKPGYRPGYIDKKISYYFFADFAAGFAAGVAAAAAGAPAAGVATATAAAGFATVDSSCFNSRVNTTDATGIRGEFSIS
jgi:hypothetical protein